MKTGKLYMFMALAIAALMVAGCRKDRSLDGLQLIAEGSHGAGAKLAIDGNNSDWAAGDVVRINGSVATVEIEEGEAHVSGSYEAPFYGIYPGDAYPSGIYRSNDGNSYTVTLPKTYTYTASGSGQSLQSPMAGYAASGNYILFRHLTSAIAVQITNYYGFTVVVDSVVIVSNNYKLSGDLTFTLGGDGLSVPATAKSGGDTVTMLGGGLQIVSGNTATVQVPVLPQGEGNLFTVKVRVHKYNNIDVKRVFESVQPHSHPLARNQIGYVPMTVGFPFSIGVSKKVIISQGNLQYQASSGTWRFAENQYGYIGNAAGNNTAAANRATQSAWIDLFGWGTSGWDNGNTYYKPYDCATTGRSGEGYGYGPKNGSNYSNSILGNFANADWGVYNRITNGGNIAGKWRTLTGNTNSEIDTLFRKRVTSTSNMPSGANSSEARFVKAMVGSTRGIIVFPDNYVHPEGASAGSSGFKYNDLSDISFTKFGPNLEAWAKMEAEGAIFLPAAGYRKSGVIVYDPGSVAWYWSASNNGTANANAIKFLDGDASSLTSYANRHYGLAVRLVQDIR